MCGHGPLVGPPLGDPGGGRPRESWREWACVGEEVVGAAGGWAGEGQGCRWLAICHSPGSIPVSRRSECPSRVWRGVWPGERATALEALGRAGRAVSAAFSDAVCGMSRPELLVAWVCPGGRAVGTLGWGGVEGGVGAPAGGVVWRLRGGQSVGLRGRTPARWAGRACWVVSESRAACAHGVFVRAKDAASWSFVWRPFAAEATDRRTTAVLLPCGPLVTDPRPAERAASPCAPWPWGRGCCSPGHHQPRPHSGPGPRIFRRRSGGGQTWPWLSYLGRGARPFCPLCSHPARGLKCILTSSRCPPWPARSWPAREHGRLALTCENQADP